MEALSLAYCETNRVQGSGQSFKALCPVCPGHNLFVTLHNGIAFCFNCFASFYIPELSDRRRESIADLLIPGDVTKIRELYANVLSIYRGNFTSDHYEYFARRGIERGTVDRFGLGYCDDNVVDVYRSSDSVDAGLCDRYRHLPVLSDRIIFPYVSGGAITDIRGRSIVGEEPKYKSLYKPSVYRGAYYPFNWDNATEKANNTKTLLITEGEIKAMAADQAGFACTALPGMRSWRKGLIPEPDWDLVIVFDTDARRKNQLDIQRAIRFVYTKFKQIKVAHLPLLGEMKMDIDAFLLHAQGGLRRFSEIISDALPYRYYAQLRGF